jgi:hypothetical protein
MDALPKSFPSVTGLDVDKAVEMIQNENPSLKVVKLKPNQPTTRDFRLDRVRVVYDPDTNLVMGVPKTG